MTARGQARLLAVLLVAAGLAGCIGDGDDVDLNSLNGLQVAVTPESGDVDTEFTFDASATPGADSLDIQWDFGDGETANGTVVTHTFLYTNNLYKVRVTASAGNQSLTSTVEVPVGSGQNTVPTIELLAERAWVGHNDPLELSAQATDPDGDPLTIRWLLTKNQGAGGGHGDGHDHDHGGSGGASGFGIPEDTGKRGTNASFTFEESGTYRIVARALDPKGGAAEQTLDVKVTQAVPKATFDYVQTNTLAVGSGGEAGASLLLYELMQPSQNTFIDAARYNVRLIYPGHGTFSLDWSNTTGPADLDAYLIDGNGDPVVELNAVDPSGTSESAPVDLPAGSYTIDLYARAGANIDYTLTLSLDLLIPGLTVDVGSDDGHDDGHDHDH